MKRRPIFSLTALLLPFLLLFNGGCAVAPETASLSEPTPTPVPSPVPCIREEAPAADSPAPEPTFTPGPTPTPAPVFSSLVLSEICYSGDEKGDWVELYNTSSAPVSAGDYCLSDRSEALQKYPLPPVQVMPGERIVFFGTEVGFALSAGETVYLTCLPANSTESLLLPQRTGYTCGRDGADPVLFLYATPGAENAPGYPPEGDIPAFEADGLYISEVSATGEEEWIELKNGGEALELTGWTVRIGSDPERTLTLSGTAEPGAFVLLEAELPASGTVLRLFDPKGFLRDTYETGLLQPGMSSGRAADGTRLFYSSPTPGKENGDKGYTGYAPAIVSSETGLYRSKPFELTLRTDRGAEIRYTLDGSEPGPKSSLYKGPVRISSSCVLKARTYAKDKLPGSMLTLHFLFAEEHTVPVVCVSMEPGEWRKLSTSKFKADPVRADLSWYESDGTFGIAFPIDIRLHGESSRYYDQKSYNIHLRARYGVKSVRYPFWQDEGAGSLSYSSFVLRSASQDHEVARMRDSFASRAVRGLHIENAMTRPVAVYVNGTYWGIYDFNERLDQHYVQTHYGFDSDTVNILYREKTVKRGTADDFLALCAFARSKKTATAEGFAELVQWIDVDYFTDYIIAQTFLVNYDTPNQRFWATSDRSLRWRPVFNDIDRCLVVGRTNENLFESYFNPAGITRGIHKAHATTDIFCALRRNREWCDSFVERYAQVLCTVFSVENLENVFDGLAAELRPEMKRHIAHWKTPDSVDAWEKNVAEMRREIALRHASVQKQIKREFSVSDEKWQSLMEKYGGTPAH